MQVEEISLEAAARPYNVLDSTEYHARLSAYRVELQTIWQLSDFSFTRSLRSDANFETLATLIVDMQAALNRAREALLYSMALSAKCEGEA